MDNTPTQDGTAPNADVIALRDTARARLKAGPIAQVEAYWHALRGDNIVPSRSQVDPRGIESVLSHSFIVERIAPGHARMRIAGTHLTDLMGMEVRGMPLSAMFDPAARDKLQAGLREVFDGPCVYKFELVSLQRIGKPEIRARIAIFPLLDDQGQVTRAIGCITTDGLIGRAPRRFDIMASSREELTGSTPSVAAPAPRQTPALGMAEKPAPFTPAAEKTAKVPYLRLVTDNS